MASWNISASLMNLIWHSFYPRIVSRIWKADACDIIPADHSALFSQILGWGSVRDYINHNRDFYFIAGRKQSKLPAFMRHILGEIQNEVESTPLINIPVLQNKVEFIFEAYQFETNPAKLDVYRELLSLVENIKDALEMFIAHRNKDDIVVLLDNVKKCWKSNFNTLTDSRPPNPLVTEGLLLNVDNFIAFVSDGTKYDLSSISFGVNDEDALISPEIELFIARQLCFDYVVIKDGIYLPWPVKPVEEKKVYDMYVVRSVRKGAIRLPGLSTASVSTPSAAALVGVAGGASGGDPATRRCVSIKDFLEDELDFCDTDDWFITGQEFERFQLALPRVIASIWGDDRLYDQFILSFGSANNMLQWDKDLACYRRELSELQRNQGCDSLQDDAARRVRIAELKMKISLRERQIAVVLKRIATKVFQASKEIETAINNAISNSREDTLEFLKKIIIHLGYIRCNNLLESRSDILRACDEIACSKLLIEDLGGVLTGITDKIDSANDILKSNDPGDESALSLIDELDIVTDFECENSELVYSNASEEFRSYYEDVAEYVFPSTEKFLIEFIPGKTSSDVILGYSESSPDDKGFLRIPLPKRPDIKELYISWSRGGSSLPTFTNTNGS